MTRPLDELLGLVSTAMHGDYVALREQVPQFAGNRAARRRQARELRRSMQETAQGQVDLVAIARDAVARRSRDQLREEVRREARAATLESRLNTDALSAALAGISAEQADKIETALTRGVEYDRNPEQVRDQILRYVGGGENPTGLEARALLLARTELAAAERAGLFAQMELSGVKQWVWVARLAFNTCPYCWSMHGTIHKVGTPLASHPACLCRPVPLLERTSYKTGIDRFEELDEDEKRRILHPAMYEAYRAGAVTLPDLRFRAMHPELGPVGGTKSLTALVGEKKALEYRRLAASAPRS